MKCEEALQHLQSLHAQFAFRYYQWSLQDSRRELEEGFPLVGAVRSSVAFRFREYASQLSQEQARLLMVGEIKRLNPQGAALAGDSVSPDEHLAKEAYLRYCRPEVVHGGHAITTIRIPAREQEFREQVSRGELSLQINKRDFRKLLNQALEPLLGSSEKGTGGLRYWSTCGTWFVLTDIDLSGRHQLTYTQQVHARPVLDFRCLTRLAEASLLSWCGIHPTTRFNLIASHEVAQAAQTVHNICAHFLRHLPKLLDGLPNEIPLQLEH